MTRTCDLGDAVLRNMELLGGIFEFQDGLYEDALGFQHLHTASDEYKTLTRYHLIRESHTHYDTSLVPIFEHLDEVLSPWYAVHGSSRVLRLVQSMEYMRLMVLVHAAYFGLTDVMSLLLHHPPFHQSKGSTSSSCQGFPHLIDLAALNGQLRMLELLHSNPTNSTATTDAMDLAARKGHVSVVRFLHFHRSEGCSHFAMLHAATNGHLNVVQFLYQFRHHDGVPAAAFVSAAANGHLEVVRFFHTNDVHGCTTRAMDLAAR
ncbi:hypothetical protein AaE_009984, partial [Aphanomyces astaci]